MPVVAGRRLIVAFSVPVLSTLLHYMRIFNIQSSAFSFQHSAFPQYHLRAIHEVAGLHELEDAWTDLLLASPTSTVFSSFQWCDAWWRHFGGGKRLNVVTVRDGSGELVGVAPLMVRRFGPFRKLEFIGAGLSDYSDFVVHPRCAQAAIGVILTFLQGRHRGWDLGDLSEVPAQSSLLSFLRARRISGLNVTCLPQTNCPFIALPTSWEAYVSALPRKRRYYVSSFPRKFMREQDGSLEVVAEKMKVEDAIATFYKLHMARWATKDQSLSHEHTEQGFLPFLEEVCMRFAVAEENPAHEGNPSRGWLRLVSLRAGSQVVASSVNFLMNGRWNSYMKGFDPQWAASRPGTVLDALRIEQAIKEGARLLDFGRGDEAYKSGFGATNSQNRRVLMATGAPRSRAAFALMMLRNRYRRSAQS